MCGPKAMRISYENCAIITCSIYIIIIWFSICTVAGAKELMYSVGEAIPWHFFYESMLEKGDK